MNVIRSRDSGLSIRPMHDDTGDYELMVRWQNAPHVREWWDYDDPPLTLGQATLNYQEDTQPGSATTPCIVELESRAIGYCQFYPWEEEVESALEIGFEPRPGWWGLDVLIGEPECTDRGIGTQVVSLLVDHLAQAHGASGVALTTSIENHRAIRCYEKSGFRKEAYVLDTDTKHGKRVQSWLMVRQLRQS